MQRTKTAARDDTHHVIIQILKFVSLTNYLSLSAKQAPYDTRRRIWRGVKHPVRKLAFNTRHDRWIALRDFRDDAEVR